jgi:hypothetical protein
VPQIPAEKSYFTFKGGLHTDSSPIDFPEEVTLDEENFTLERDGSRKRRRGLQQETGGLDRNLNTSHSWFDDNQKVVTSYNWKNAAGDSSLDYIIVQLGQDLLFYADQDPISSSAPVQVISIAGYKSDTSLNDDEVEEYPVSFASIRGVLVVSGKHVDPFYIEYDEDDAEFVTYPITLRERDFVGIDDGIPANSEPSTTAITGDALTDHKYNLRIRGWKDADITQYVTDTSTEYPAKNMIPWMGYKRIDTTSGVNPADGIQTWDTTKLQAELFGDSTAPTGALLIVPWNKTGGSGASGGALAITTWSTPDENSATTWTITATTESAHGISSGETFTIDGNAFRYNWEFGDHSGIYYKSYDGTRTADSVTSTTLTFEAGYFPFFLSWYDTDEDGSTYSVGYVGGTGSSEPVASISTDNQFVTDERPQVVASFAGRAWYTGIEHPKLENRVYFSKIVEEPNELGTCHQVADPTHQTYNSLVATDGGVAVIPDMGLVRDTLTFGDSLLLFAVNGVWSIQGTSQNGFAANAYVVRKVSDIGLVSKYGAKRVDDSIYWPGEQGLFRLFQDPQTGFLTSQSATKDRIDKLWDQLGDNTKSRIKMAYDKYKHRLYLLYQSDNGAKEDEYDTALVYCVDLRAFYKLVFPVDATATAESSILHLFSVNSGTNAESDGNIKFIWHTGGWSGDTTPLIQMGDMNQSDYEDWDENEQVPFMVTGYDNLGDFHRRKQAPVIHVFMNKTETGYTEVDTDLVPINESSILMQSVWDFSDRSTNSASQVVGHFGEQRQVYRHRRYYQPVDDTDTFDDGFPVVVTRNKVRGSGRVLHLRFDGETAKDAHIFGWSINYRATRRV